MINNKLSIEEMKKISHEIIDEEVKRTGIKDTVFPLTFIEYYSDFLFKQKFNLLKKSYLSVFPMLNVKIGGFNDLKGTAVIFLDRVNRIDNNYFHLVRACYHEFRHSEQLSFEKSSYAKFLTDIEMYILKCGYYGAFDYSLEHDKYSFEIGANIYSTHKAREYLKKNYSNIYEKEKDVIKYYENRYNIDYYTYDASDVFERFIGTYRSVRSIVEKATKSMLGNNMSIDDINPLLSVFLKENGKFKPFNEIINNEEFNKIDIRIKAAILSCDSFLRSINIEDLNDKELMVLKDSIEYTNKVYDNQKIMLDKLLSENKDISLDRLSSIKRLSKKAANFKRIVLKVGLSSIGLMRNDKNRLKHINNVSSKNDEISNIIVKK